MPVENFKSKPNYFACVNHRDNLPVLIQKLGMVVNEGIKQHYEGSLAEMIHNWDEKFNFLSKELAIEYFKNTAYFKMINAVTNSKVFNSNRCIKKQNADPNSLALLLLAPY